MMYRFLLILCVASSVYGGVERRAAIDVGSGGTKLAIADVDDQTQQLTQLLVEKSFPVPYQDALDHSNDGTFDEETQRLGLDAFQEMKEVIEAYQVEKVVAIATSAFRKANNAEKVISAIEKETDIHIEIISQREEGELAFFSALSTNQCDAQEDVVVDIGTGSLQMTASNKKGELVVYMGEQMGAVAFKNYIISTIQDKDSSSPNPISEQDLKESDRYARGFARQAYPLLKQKILKKGSVYGIGRLFYHSLRPIASDQGVITREKLRDVIENALNKTDAELNNPFAHLDISNCILTLGLMKALHIHEIHPLETTATRGLLIAPSYWEG